MRSQIFKTRVTDIFGMRHPILAGGLMWLADGRYVGSVGRAGGIGFMTPRSFPTPDDYRAEIKKARDLAKGGPIGVNLYISARPEENEKLMGFLDIALGEGVRNFETAAYIPERLIEPIKKAGGKIAHKCTMVRHALAAERIGVDAVILVGAECGGHPGMNQVPAMVLLARALEKLKVPVIIGGGIGSGRQIAAALAMGAEGVLLGTRLLVAEEVWAHPAYKAHLTTLDENASTTVLFSMKNTYRCLDNETARKVQAIEAAGARDYAAFGDLIKGTLTRECYVTGDFNKGILSAGPSVAFADKIEPMETIFDRLIDEAAEHAKRLAGLTRAA